MQDGEKPKSTAVHETGHAINISNFKTLIDYCSSFSDKYKPSREALTVDQMTALWQTADTAHQALTTAIQNAKEPINQREILFEPVDKLVTRTLNYFESTEASDQIKLDAKGLADKYRGFKVKVKKLPDGTSDPNDVSQSHQSYVMKGDTFRQLVDLYKAQPLYLPNEPELGTAALGDISLSMKALNDGIGEILAPIENARTARDTALYADKTGIIDISLACKDYVQGAFGASSPEAKMVRGLEFTRKKKSA
ncbi:MAG: hypothetical protein WC644_10010 [Ignavibacteria bacterium]